MKLRCKNKLDHPIRAVPGDTVNVVYTQTKGGKEILSKVVAKCLMDKEMMFNTAFIYELEQGDLGFEQGFIGGLAWENEE